MQTTVSGVTLQYAVDPNGLDDEGELRVEVLEAHGHLDMDFGVASCRLCGCTEDHACPGGCAWVTDPAGGDLCSECMDAAFTALRRHMEGTATPDDVDLLHRFAETGPHRDDPPLALVQVGSPTA